MMQRNSHNGDCSYHRYYLAPLLVIAAWPFYGLLIYLEYKPMPGDNVIMLLSFIDLCLRFLVAKGSTWLLRRGEQGSCGRWKWVMVTTVILLTADGFFRLLGATWDPLWRKVADALLGSAGFALLPLASFCGAWWIRSRTELDLGE